MDRLDKYLKDYPPLSKGVLSGKVQDKTGRVWIAIGLKIRTEDDVQSGELIVRGSFDSEKEAEKRTESMGVDHTSCFDISLADSRSQVAVWLLKCGCSVEALPQLMGIISEALERASKRNQDEGDDQ